MKILLSFLMVFFSIFHLIGQNEKLGLEIQQLDKGNYYLLTKNRQVIDSLLITHTHDVLVDYRVINEKKVFFVKKDHIGYFYYNFEKSDGVWTTLITSGQVGSNYGYRGFIHPEQVNMLLNVEYEILEEDKILIRNGKNCEQEQIFDCCEIGERRKDWLEKIEKSQKSRMR